MRSVAFFGFLLLGLLNPAGASAAWQDQWEATLKAAKEEGKVSMFGPVGADRRDALTLAFQKKYGIEVDYIPDPSRGIPPRVAATRRAGQYLWDVVVAGALEVLLLPMNVLDPVEQAIILPEVKDKSQWRGGDLEFLDAGRTVLVMTPYQRAIMFINRNEVDVKEITSYKDLLLPKWKGKIVSDDPRKPGPGEGTYLFFYLHPNLGPDFIRSLAKQELLLLKDYAQEMDMVGSAKYPIGIALSDSIAEQRMRQGVPIAIVDPRQLKEGSDISPAAGQFGLFNRAPHPNAARVYVNWLLSKEGQTAFARATGYISSRLDVPTDHAAPWRVPQPGAIKTYGLPARKVVKEQLRPLMDEVFGR